MANLGLSNFDMHPRHLLNLFVYSTSTNGLLLWYMAVCTPGLKVLTVLTRANETNGYSDYDAVAFIVTTMEKKTVLYEGTGGACWHNVTQLSERHDVSK